ncbi:MAG TPA: M1 family metallopeptidase [Myxococcota bacterium]|nr:M1 family metallopeptidase [Myxococcota bacterium]
MLPLPHVIVAFALAALAAEPTVAAVKVVKPAPAVAAEEPSPGFRIPVGEKPLEYSLSFDIDPSKESFTGKETVRVHLDIAQKTVWLHGRGLEVQGAKIAGQAARYKQIDDDGMARLSLDALVGPGDVDVEIAWTARFNDALQGIYRVQSEGSWYVFTQFEAVSARDGFPCFDEPGFKTPFSLSLNIPEGDHVVANTHEARSQEIEDARVHVEMAKTDPLPVYLLAFAVGPFDIVDGETLPPSALRKEPLPIRAVATKGHGAQLRKSLDVAAKALTNLEEWFDYGYPFHKMDILAVPDFAAGAMENAGLVTFRDSLLFADDKSSIGLQKANVYVIAHEFAHQWFGDLVTLAWWDDIWLNEAFATWMEAPIAAAIRPDFHVATDMRSGLDAVTADDSLVSARQIRQPVLSKGDIINAFDGITYTKGASVIEMFASYMGRAQFQLGVRNYIQEHAFGTATAKDLLGALSKAGGSDIATPFSTFLDQPGVPYVEVKLVCDAGKKGSSLELEQSRFLPIGTTGDRARTWQVPVCVRTDAATVPVCTLLSSKTGALALSGCPKWVHPNADGVGYYRWELPPDQLRSLSSSLTILSPGERISFANAVRAGFDAATLRFADALDAALPLALDEEPSVAKTPLGFLGFAREDLVEPAARAQVEAKIAATYRPVLDKVKLDPRNGEDPRARERRTVALGALVWGAEDRATLDTLAKRGRPVLDLDGKTDRKVHLDKINGDLANAAIYAAVRQGGVSAWDYVAALVSRETDSVVRAYLLGALCGTHDPALSAKALELTLDPHLKVSEVLTPLAHQAGDFHTREAAWTWLQAHYDGVMRRLPEQNGGDRITSIFRGFCSEDKAQEVDSFFTPKKAKTPGMERSLATTLESIRLCAAKKRAHEESAKEMFSSP